MSQRLSMSLVTATFTLICSLYNCQAPTQLTSPSSFQVYLSHLRDEKEIADSHQGHQIQLILPYKISCITGSLEIPLIFLDLRAFQMSCTEIKTDTLAAI